MTGPESATLSDWIEGARLRTLPVSVAPVFAGTGLALFYAQFRPTIAILCMIIAVSLQVGVNYANDYSDGIRGTDADRVGPMRLVGSGLVSPDRVKMAAFTCFGIAAGAGLAITAMTGQWWLLIVGAAAILAAWYYTGGPHPYGYAGFGEVFVMIFFGLIATAGTALTQIGFADRQAWLPALLTALAIGWLACAVLMANNIRDIAGDRDSGKRTLAVRIGDRASRWVYLGMLVAAAVSCIALAAITTWWALASLIFLVLIAPAVYATLRGATGPDLIQILKRTGQADLVCSIGLFFGLAFGG